MAHPFRQYRNPISLAQEWQSMLGAGECPSRADLARKLGVTRARVTQVLGLLELAPDVVTSVLALGDPLPQPIVTERMLRPLLKLPAEVQRHVLQATCACQIRWSVFSIAADIDLRNQV
jgi:hypothetical protein